MSNRLYFGYGERTPEVMGAIIGRKPDYEPAALPGFRLFVQRAIDMPPAVQEIMAINRTPEEMERLQNYAAKETGDGYVPGLVYDITEDEVPILDNFDIEGLWFKSFKDRFIRIANSDGVTTRLGAADYHAEPHGDLVIPVAPFDGLFPAALSDPTRTMEIARTARETLLS